MTAHLPLRSLSLAAVAALTVGGSALAAPPAGAQTLSAPQTVRSGAAVSWQTPATNRAHASITNQTQSQSAASIITLRDASAPTTYTFPLSLPATAAVQLQADGGAAVTSQGRLLGVFEKPWARDAAGRSLQTSYRLATTASGATALVQTIDTRHASFPVTADPKFTWGWVSGTVYFNKSETRRIATGASIASWIPNPYAVIGGRSIAAWASIAVATNRCIKFKVSAFSAILAGSGATPGYYTGGYCT